ncbi:MAG: methyltransferase domain-containing protein [Candidatus Eremiobacteraeota bacterium]|nr:methyltransferase domain-containing protein [Candidatus Eremiobacteraeota bacterium]
MLELAMSDIGSHTDYYNAAHEDFAYPNLLQLERATRILEVIRSTGIRSPKICDLGSGPGWFTAVLGVFGPTVGVDLSDVATKQAAARYPLAHFACADILSWRPPKNKFDIIVSQEVVEHLSDHERHISMAYEMLRPGGSLILTTPNARTMKATPEHVRRAWTNQPVENYMSQSALRSLLMRYFTEVKLDSMILGLGSAGLYRVVNSTKVRQALKTVGLAKAWTSAACKANFGLHLLASGRKPRTSP